MFDWLDLAKGYQGSGLQVAAFSYDDGQLYSEAIGSDLVGRELSCSTIGQLYCMSKPLYGATLASSPELVEILSRPVGGTLEELRPDLAKLDAWSLLNHSAALDPVPTGVLAAMPRASAVSIALSLGCDSLMNITGLARYQDTTPWLLVDEILIRSTGTGLFERCHQKFGHAELAFLSSPEEASSAPVLAVDGVTGPPLWIPFHAINHESMMGDRSPILASVGSAEGLARAMALLGHQLESDAAVRQRLVPDERLPYDPTLNNGSAPVRSSDWNRSESVR